MKDSWTDLQVIVQLSSGSHWYGSTITYAFPTLNRDMYASSGERIGFSSLTGSQIISAHLALFTWDDLIRPNFQQAATSNSNIEFGYTNTGIEYAHAYLPDIGSVWFSSAYASLRNPVLGGYGYNTYVHEIGHALGLDHMGDYNGSSTSGASSWQDSSVYTVMSYYGPSNSLAGEGQVGWADWIGSDGVEYSPQTPMVNDVMAIQSIYGQGTTRADNTVYGFGSNITGQGEAIYDFTENLHPILCIFDTDGVDTLNLSGWASSSTVDLMGGSDHFTSCNSMTNNIQIARGTLIESAITGAGNDVIYGNTAANLLQANNGADRLFGGDGNDTLSGGDGNDTLSGGDGNDTLSGGDGNDTLYGGMGNDSINGGVGIDTMALDGSRVDYLVDYQIATSVYTVSAKTGLDGTDMVSQVEWLQFADGGVELAFLASSAVYRFYNTATGVHFYSGSAIEAEHVRNTMPVYSYEGIAFNKNHTTTGDVIDVFRFFNTSLSAHFYTANSQEADNIRKNLPWYRDEGVAYQAHSQDAEGATALYRFYNTTTGTHFYTANEAERSQVLLTLAGTMNYEGIAYYIDL